MHFDGSGAKNWMSRFLDERLNRLERSIRSDICPMLQQYAQQHAPWTDRTGAARRGLHSTYTKQSSYNFLVHLSHGVDYGIFLEKANSGRFAILNPTVEAMLPRMTRTLKGVWR